MIVLEFWMFLRSADPSFPIILFGVGKLNLFILHDFNKISFQSFQISPQNIIPNVEKLVISHFKSQSQKVQQEIANHQTNDQSIVLKRLVQND